MPPEVKEDSAVIDRMLEYFVNAYDRRYMEKSRPYDGIRDMLADLEKEGIMTAVNSNKRTDYTEKLIAALFPGVPFVGVFGERAGVPKKPDPASALELCGIMGLEPAEVLLHWRFQNRYADRERMPGWIRWGRLGIPRISGAS